MRVRTVVSGLMAAGLTLAFMPFGCGGIEHVPLRQQPTDEHPALPRISAERLHDCVKKYGDQLDGRSGTFSPKVKANWDGRVTDVYAGNIPGTAPDLAACIRITLHQMSVPAWMLRIRPAQNMRPPEGSAEAVRNELANPVIVGWALVIVFAELTIDVEGILILLAVTLEISDGTSVIPDVTDAEKRRTKDECADKYAACMDTPLGDLQVDVHGTSLCETCRTLCQKDEAWPLKVKVTQRWHSCTY